MSYKHGEQTPPWRRPSPAMATLASGPPPPGAGCITAPWRVSAALAPPPCTTASSSTSRLPAAPAPSAKIRNPPWSLSLRPPAGARYTTAPWVNQHVRDPVQPTPASTPPWLQQQSPAAPVTNNQDHTREWANTPATKGHQKPKPVGDTGRWEQRPPGTKKKGRQLQKKGPGML